MGYIFCVLEKPTTNMTRYWSLGSCNCYTSNFREKSGFREQPCAWKHQCKEKKLLRKVEGEILQNLIRPGIFTVWKRAWHIISGGQRGPVMFLMLVLEMLTVLLMLTSTISLNVALWSTASMIQAFVLAFFSASLMKELDDLYFSSMRETSFQFVSVYSAKNKKKKIIIISVLNMAYDILKSRCMLGLAWYREWWSTEVLIRGMKPRLTESSGKFVFGLNKALIILVVFLPNFFFFLSDK